MKKFLSRVFGTKSPITSKRSSNNFRPAVEDLEGRALMSVVGPELHVNTTTYLNQYQVDVASQPVVNGRSVVVWTHQYNPSGEDTDIRAQIYDGFGNKIGSEITIAGNIFQEREPSVAMDAAGNFVVVWVENINNAGNTGIFAQRYFANGVANGGRIFVGADARNEYDPSVAMDNAGNFVVSYTLQYSANDTDVYAKRYAANGTFLGANLVAGSGLHEYSSSVARTADGRFSIAYQIQRPYGSTTQGDIMLSRYSAGGTLLGSHQIANSTRAEFDPDVAMDNAGNSMVVYQLVYGGVDHDIHARRVSSTGVLGSAISVDSSGHFEYNPTIAMDASDGDFVVAYERYNVSNGTLVAPHQAIVREFSATGALKSSTSLGDRSAPAISMNGSDVYFLADVGYNLFGDQWSGIFARRGVLI